MMRAHKADKARQRRPRPPGNTAKARSRYRVVGTTKDGVTVLRAKVKPTHFTTKQIRRAIARVTGRGSARA